MFWGVWTSWPGQSPAPTACRACAFLNIPSIPTSAPAASVSARRHVADGEQDTLFIASDTVNTALVGEGDGATFTMWKMDYANESLYRQGTCSARGACRMGLTLQNVSGVVYVTSKDGFLLLLPFFWVGLDFH